MGAVTADAIIAEAAAIDAVRTYLRIDSEAEDSMIAGLIVAAMAACEVAVGQTLVTRGFTETLVPRGDWQVLARAPVRTISGVGALAVSDYEVDITAYGDGRVRIRVPVTPTTIAVAYQAGMATKWDGLPELVRHGVIRLVAHWYNYRDRIDDPALPPAINVLWQGARRMRMA